MAREWKVGDWCEFKGKRHLVYNVTQNGCVSIVWLVSNNAYGDRGHSAPASTHAELVHLPDCTGWNWEAPKPPEPPDGYRFLTKEEIETGTIQKTDLFYTSWGEWEETNSPGCEFKFADRIYARKVEPPKLFEAPPGCRFLEEGEVVLPTDMYLHYHGYFENFDVSDVASGSVVGKPYNAKKFNPIARKVEPKYRPFANAAEFATHRDKWVVDEGGDCLQVVMIRRDAKLATWRGTISFKDAFLLYKFEDGSPFGVLETAGDK